MTNDKIESILACLADTGYAIVDNALPAAFGQCQSAWQALNENQLTPAGVGRGQAARIEQVRRDKIAWITDAQASIPLYWQSMETLRLAVNKAFYLGLFDFECHFSQYQKGDFYRKHLDAFRGQSNRRLSTIYYLNDHWQPGDGGELVVYQRHNAEQVAERVLPFGNRLVVFFSEEFEHEVLVANRDRCALTGWFRVR